MEGQLDKPLLFDEENTQYADWKDHRTSSLLWKKRITVLSFLTKLLINICSAMIILLVLAFLWPRFVLSCLQHIPGSQIDIAYKHCKSLLVVVNNLHLTTQVPLRSDIRWVELPGDPDYWENTLYMGEASPESDLAWNQLIRSRFNLS